ncbi:MAG: hypothetical protein JNN11_03180 [Candidatus Doudnabacteria bacterium]|nr:hypothetical protein [Candidatus Doudnabacteria bacterium]
MKQKYNLIFIVSAMLFLPFVVFAAPKEVTFTGVVTGRLESRVMVRTTKGTVYSPDIGNAKLYRKNGTVMNLDELLTGDKVEVKGTLWSDNSFSAVYLKNLSLYPKESTFSGKIVSVNPALGTAVLQSSQYGLHNITTGQFTAYKKNGKSSSLTELESGMSAQVKGTWERSREKVQAKSIDAKLRLVSIEFTGNIVLKGPGGMTVASGNTLYGVDTVSAKFQNKAGSVVEYNKFGPGQEVRVKGKHMSGDVKVVAETVRQLKNY